ncbi:F-box/LRR-repeat protein 6 isoform X6 [Pseudorca crassidens]|uniref:F-box/LRR-repeat protein 6 isoform X6 n=1 Tax=Pseudorca crassidens TaxID=82174 RepID=UPI00352C4DA7
MQPRGSEDSNSPAGTRRNHPPARPSARYTAPEIEWGVQGQGRVGPARGPDPAPRGKPRLRRPHPFRRRLRLFRSPWAELGTQRVAMAPGVARRARQRVRILPLAGARSRSAEDWWWDRLAPSGSGYHLLQSDSMLLVLPGPGPARRRAQRRAARRAQLLRLHGARAAEAKAKPRTAPAPAPAPQQEPDPGWGDRIPLEILLQIFGLLVAADGPIPFLGRAARVCRRWHEAASQPALWHTLTLSPPLVGRPAKSGTKTEKKLLTSLEWLMPSRFSQLQRLTLIHWKSQVHPVLKLVSESCPRLTFLKLSDCHGVTPDTLIMLAKACPQLHSLDIQHSMVSPGVPRGPKEAWATLTGTSVLGLQVESTAVVSFLEEAGPRMRKLWLTYSSQTTAILGALLGSCCPQLQLLEVSTGLNHNSTPLQLPVEALQKGCPQLQRCDQQLPGSAVPQPGVLPLPSPGPEAGLPGRRGSPVVPAAAAHQPGPSQLGSSSQPALPCPLSQF